MNNNVMVFVADQEHLDPVKSSIHQARTTGGWSGDIVVILPKGTEHDLNDEVFYSDLTVVDNKFHKLSLFHPYFKKWDWIFYCDLDTIILDKINLRLDDREKQYVYANPDGKQDINYQFMLSITEINNLLGWTQKGWGKLTLSGTENAFQTCLMLFHSSIGDWERTKQYYCWLNPFTATRGGGTLADQSVINLLYFLNNPPLGTEFRNRCQAVEDNHFDLDLLKKGVYDKDDYTGVQILHFGWVFSPWFEWNTRWHPVYKEHLNKYKEL